MSHHSVKGILLLRQDDARVLYHAVRAFCFGICLLSAGALLRFWTNRWQHDWMGVEARTLLTLLNMAVVVILYFWKPPRGAIYLRRRPVHSCRNCGYNLKGNIDGRCSECGEKNPTHISRMIGLPFMRIPHFNRPEAARSTKTGA